jgi:hypothetical protein
MKIGRRWDVKRNKIRNKIPFNLPVLTKMFSAISYMPGLNHVLIPINNTFYNKYSKGLKGKELIGPAHVDGDRAFTILLGSRDRVKTEVYDNENWHSIKLTTNSAHIFPGKYLNGKNGIRPTYHRYYIDELDDNVSEKKPNITLLLGIVKPKPFNSFQA